MPEQLMTVAEVAIQLRLTSQTVRSLIQRKELAGVRIGNSYRIPSAAVAKILAPCQSEAS